MIAELNIGGQKIRAALDRGVSLAIAVEFGGGGPRHFGAAAPSSTPFASGKFTGSVYNANYRVGLQTGINPIVQSKYGAAVSEATKAEIATALEKIKAPGASVFTGPIKDQDGKVVIAEGTALQYGDPGIEGMDWFVDGVVGTIAK